jgi:hypothetical protein
VIFYSFGSCYAGRLCSEQQQPHGALESMNGSSLTLREQTSKQTGGIESDIFFRLYEPELRYFSDVLAFFCTCSGARAIASWRKSGAGGQYTPSGPFIKSKRVF